MVDHDDVEIRIVEGGVIECDIIQGGARDGGGLCVDLVEHEVVGTWNRVGYRDAECELLDCINRERSHINADYLLVDDGGRCSLVVDLDVNRRLRYCGRLDIPQRCDRFTLGRFGQCQLDVCIEQ